VAVGRTQKKSGKVGDRDAAAMLSICPAAMTLVIALFGLLAGAKEQLLSSTFYLALLAVFMVALEPTDQRLADTKDTRSRHNNSSSLNLHGGWIVGLRRNDHVSEASFRSCSFAPANRPNKAITNVMASRT